MNGIRYDDYDESDVRVRPNRRGSRPRTKDRPAHEDAEVGLVTAVDRGRFTVRLADRTVTAMKARTLPRGSIVVGDRACLVGDTTGAEGSLARIVRVEERTSVLRRTADDTDPVERVIVANADQLVIVASLTNPEPRPRLIDRALVAAYDAGMTPLLVLTKSDLADPAPFLAQYAPLGVPHLVTSVLAASGEQDGVGAVREALRGHASVLLGHSGVGKSTLVNVLVPDADRRTGVTNDVTGRGRHTSTSAVALELPEGGWVIDTPGVRSFGLAHVEPERIIEHFPDLLPGTEGCPRGCTHDEEECGLDAYAGSGAAGAAGPARLESLRRLLRARTGES